MEPFVFKECISMMKSTGKKAATLRELRDTIALVSDSSIFHHTYQYFLKGRMLEYTNDFAEWAGVTLEERVLAEHLSNIDPYEFNETGVLRKEILNVIDTYLKNFPEPRRAMAGNEFYFNETITIVAAIGIKARNLAEFLVAVKYLEPASIYYHFHDARVRLSEKTDDFSHWFEKNGMKDLANEIRKLDLFMHNIEDIRCFVIDEIEKEVKKIMEGMEQ